MADGMSVGGAGTSVPTTPHVKRPALPDRPGEDRTPEQSRDALQALKSLEPSAAFAGVAGYAYGVGRVGRPTFVSRSATGQAMIVLGVGALAGASHGLTTAGINRASEALDVPSIVPYSALSAGGIALFTGHLYMRTNPKVNAAMQGFGALGMLVGGTGSLMAVTDAFDGHDKLDWVDTASKAVPVAAATALTIGALKGGYRNDGSVVPTRVIDQMANAFKDVRARPLPAMTKVEQSAVALEHYGTSGKSIKAFLDDATPMESLRRVWGEGVELGTPKRIMAPLQVPKEERATWTLQAAEKDGVFSGDVDEIMIGASTGTGLFQPVFAQTFEMMGKGRTAILGTQYSNKSSFMSTSKVPQQTKQLVALIQGGASRIARMPEGQRPDLVIGGESMGSWTSQNAVASLMGIDLADESIKSLDQVRDLKDLHQIGVKRALWAGTPANSRFQGLILAHEAKKPLAERIAVKVESIEEFEALPQQARDQVQMVFLTHGNDAVTQLGFKSLLSRTESLSGHRSRSVREDARWMPVTTMIDMILDEAVGPAMQRGQMTATGHAYQASFPPLAREVLARPGSVGAPTFGKIQRELAALELRRHPDVPAKDRNLLRIAMGGGALTAAGGGFALTRDQ